MSVAEILSAGFLAVGLFFVLVSAIGFARLPDVFSRLHVTGIMDTMGVPLVMIAAAIHTGVNLVSLKLLVAVVFLSVTSPLVAHLLARAALEAGHRPGVIDESAEFEARLGPADPPGSGAASADPAPEEGP